MKRWTFAWVAVLTVFAIGCDATVRYKILSTFFDGVRPPTEAAVAGKETAPNSAPLRLTRTGEHGPYAAKLCTACHASIAGNTFVAPKEQLCFRCHEIKTDKKFVHGPLASGGCLACHDPHGSRYRYLLIAEADDFCLRCHDRRTVAKNAAHTGVDAPCTSCHDPHMSDRKYLLR